MKKLLLLLLTALAFTFGCFALASCDSTEEATPTEGLEYILNDDDESYSVTGIGSATDTDIVIASTYEGKPVTAIAAFAFFECENLTRVTIPDSVTSIGKWVFEYCTSLTNVTISSSVTSIGGWAFWYCESLSSIIIPNSVTSIDNRAFWYCESLTSITFQGTTEQWNAIEKAKEWNFDTGNCTVICTNGKLDKYGIVIA